MKLRTSVLALILGVIVLAVATPALSDSHTIWHSPLVRSVNTIGGEDLDTYPYYSLAGLTIRALDYGGPYSVEFPLVLPSDVVIDSVTICFRNFSSDNYVAQISLLRMMGPMSAPAIHEESTHLSDEGEFCHTTHVGGEYVDGTITLSVGFYFGDIYDSILVGAIGVHVSTPLSAVDEQPHSDVGTRLSLHQNRPNPFGPSTVIEYSLPDEGKVDLEVLDVAGRVVRVLLRAEQPMGEYRVIWDGRDDLGNEMPSGKYYYCVRAGDTMTSRGMVLLK
jgi:hypothetical protein